MIFFFFLDYRPIRIELPDGAVLMDWKQPPPDTVYVVGVAERKEA